MTGAWHNPFMLAPVPAPRDFAFRIPGPLLGWMRAGRHGTYHTYDPPEQVAYKRMVAIIAKQAMVRAGIFKPIEGPLALSFVACYPHPKKGPRRIHKASKPDLSNLIKNVEDALNGIAWPDDARIAQYGPCHKWYLPPGMPGPGYAWVFIQGASADEYPFESTGSARALPSHAGEHGSEGEGRA